MKRILPRSPVLYFSFAALLAGASANAQTQVYFENFETDHRLDGTWVTNAVGGYNPVDLFFDYSSVGIPPAPNTAGGTTRGLKLQANLDPAVGVFPSGVTVSPAGFSITENFEMRLDWWLNYNGPLNGGGNGSTQIGGAGFGTAGAGAQVAGAGIDSIFVGASGDGTGTSADYRVYSPAFPVSLQDASGVYVAGSRNNTASYYATNFPAQSAPAAQLQAYPQQTGQTQAGSQGFKWHDVSLRKVGNLITYSIDGILIARIDASTNGTLGGANILFTHFDINAGVSTDPNATNLAFSLIDNVRITNFASVVSIEATQPNAMELQQTVGQFTVTRNSVGSPLTVNYVVSGTALAGTDYAALPGTVSFGANETTAIIDVTPVDDTLSENVETVTVSLTSGAGYVAAGNATVTISDNDTPTLDISVVQPSMYERLNGDFARFRLTRRGDLSTSFDANITYGGNAVANTDYVPMTTVSIAANALTNDFDITPINNSILNGPRTVTASLSAGTGYAIGENTPVSAVIIDDEVPAETVLWSDNLQTDTSANWKLAFGATNGAPLDYVAAWAYDYSANSIPPAPHSGTDTHGLRLTVNKGALSGGAGLNAYPVGQSFSGNYALRFDLYLTEGTVGTSENVLFGINHSGTKTNWFRSGGVPVGWEFDGLFYSVEADSAAQFVGDYVLSSSPTTGNNPTVLAAANASSFLGVFKSPPWTSGLVGGGVPANLLSTLTPNWADVEVSQIGKVVTLVINRKVILAYTNTTAFTSGNIMLGYLDAFDSQGSEEASAIFANVRVVSLAAPNITYSQLAGGNAQIDFEGSANDVVGQFVLQSASSVAGPYADVTATISSPSAGKFRATKAASGTGEFYRIRRVY